VKKGSWPWIIVATLVGVVLLIILETCTGTLHGCPPPDAKAESEAKSEADPIYIKIGEIAIVADMAFTAKAIKSIEQEGVAATIYFHDGAYMKIPSKLVDEVESKDWSKEAMKWRD